MYYQKTILRWVAMGLVAAFCCGHSYTIAAGTMIGQMVWVKGVVKATSPGGAPRVLQRQSPVSAGDTVSTGSDGTGQIVFTDGSLLSLRSDTVLSLSQYHYAPGENPQQNSQVMDLIKGGFRTVTGFIAHTHVDGYKVNTPVATIGVRGTDYTVVYSMIAGLSVKLDQGAIKLMNAGGQADLNVKTSNIFAQIRNVNQAPQAKKTVPPTFASQPSPVKAPPPAIRSGPASAGAAGGSTQGKPQPGAKSEKSSDSGAPDSGAPADSGSAGGPSGGSGSSSDSGSSAGSSGGGSSPDSGSSGGPSGGGSSPDPGASGGPSGGGGSSSSASSGSSSGGGGSSGGSSSGGGSSISVGGSSSGSSSQSLQMTPTSPVAPAPTTAPKTSGFCIY